MFNFQKLCDDFNIPYNTTGKNTNKDWINLQCPFSCGDTSNHLGFNIKDNYFHCWKCVGTGYHSIKSAIKKLLPNENTKEIINHYTTNYIIKEQIKKKINKNTTIKVPGEPLQTIHKNYLRNRNFNPSLLETKYQLKGTTFLSNYKLRIIAPIFYHNQIVSYQGRDITDLSEMRYKACSKENEIIHHKHILYNLDNCRKSFVVVTEGITDVWRLGDNSCCTFGKGYTNEQLYILSKYEHVFIFFDPDKAGEKSSNKLSEELDAVGVNTYIINNDCDPADMKQEDADYFMKNLIKNI